MNLWVEGGRFNIFWEQTLEDVFNRNGMKIKSKIESEERKYLCSTDEEEYINSLFEDLKIEIIDITFDEIVVSDNEREVNAEDIMSESWRIAVEPGERCLVHFLIYHVPIKGNLELLHCKPKSHICLNTCQVWIENENDKSNLCFEIMDLKNTPEELKKRTRERLGFIKQQYEYIINNVNTYNENLEDEIRSILKSRKEKVLQQIKILKSLDVPIKKKEDIPKTFSVVFTKKKNKIPKTKETIKSKEKSKVTYKISDEIYFDILNSINKMGKEFERLPRLYKDKNEETLRDHILFVLDLLFEYEATGETFNKKGKTDVLLKYDSTNVFVAECKFWKGEKSMLRAIDQLLSYLTWRDSKTALILFIKLKKISSILNTIKEYVKSHPCCIKFIDKNDESWFNFEFHLIDDDNSKIKMAILLYHISD